MRSKTLLGIVQLAVMVAIGMTQLHDALPVMARLAQRTAAPLEQMIYFGVTPPSPLPPVPAVQPFAAAPVQVCDRPILDVPPVHLRTTVLHVEAPRVNVETIADPIPARFVVPHRVIRVAAPDQRAIAQMVQLRMNQADLQRQMARAQREIERAMREAQRQQEINF